MNRNLRIERLYPLGDYKNIKFYDEIEGVPEELAYNKEVVGLLQIMLMLQCDRGYLEYKKMLGDLTAKMNVDEMIAYVDDLREQTLQTLNNYVNNKKEGE